MEFGYVYCIRNVIDDKVYIGKTTHSMEKRWKQHLGEVKTSLGPLYCAMRDEGVEFFTMECIDIVPLPLLDDREQERIRDYRATDRDYGYNTIIRKTKKLRIRFHMSYEDGTPYIPLDAIA